MLRGERSSSELPVQAFSPCKRRNGELRLLPVLPARGSGPVFFACWARFDLRTALDFIVCLFAWHVCIGVSLNAAHLGRGDRLTGDLLSTADCLSVAPAFHVFALRHRRPDVNTTAITRWLSASGCFRLASLRYVLLLPEDCRGTQRNRRIRDGSPHSRPR